jgi:hypothetical protein
MNTTTFIKSFRNLQTTERDTSLEALTKELTPYEWRHLHAITSTRSFQFDIIGQLPVELVAQLFQHLDTTSPYRYQIVSRRWNNTLKSLHILKASLAQWDPSTLTLQDTSYDSCLKRARRIHAFRTGNPTSILKIIPTNKISEVLLKGDHLIWLQPQNYIDTLRHAYILCLPSWTLRTVSGEAREQLRNVFASDKLVVLTTFTNTIYVHEIGGSQRRKKFRIPSKQYRENIGVRGTTVACVADLTTSTHVYIWEFCCGRGTSFKLDHSVPDSLFALSRPDVRDVHKIAPLIQTASKTIIVFTNAYLDDKPDQRNIAFGRYTYTGECLGTWQPELPGIGNILSWSNARSFVPTGYPGQWAMWVMSRPWNDETRPAITTSFQLKFDEKDNDLSIWEGTQLSGSSDNKNNIGFYTGGCLAWWKDTCYGYLRPADEAEDRVMLSFVGTEDEERYRSIVAESREVKMAHAWENVAAPVQLNEKYVVRNVLDRAYVLCFEEDESGRRPKENGWEFFDQGVVEVLR